MALKWTRIAAVVDESGSMASHKSEAVDAYADFMSSMAEIGPTRISLTQFDSTVKEVYQDTFVADLPRLDQSYHPEKGGGTALFDAVGATIGSFEQRLTEREHAGRVVMVIISDGDDNESRRYTADSLKRLVQEKQRKDWIFYYIGVGQTANRLGIPQDRQFKFTGVRGELAKTMAQIASHAKQLLLAPPRAIEL